jgi:hypothetical protein
VTGPRQPASARSTIRSPRRAGRPADQIPDVSPAAAWRPSRSTGGEPRLVRKNSFGTDRGPRPAGGMPTVLDSLSGPGLRPPCYWHLCQRALGLRQVGREAWSAMFVIFGFVDGPFLMSGNGAPADSSPEVRLAVPTFASAVNPTVAPGGALACWYLTGDCQPGRQRAPIPWPGPDRAGCRRRQALRGQVLHGRKCNQMTPYPLRNGPNGVRHRPADRRDQRLSG